MLRSERFCRYLLPALTRLCRYVASISPSTCSLCHLDLPFRLLPRSDADCSLFCQLLPRLWVFERLLGVAVDARFLGTYDDHLQRWVVVGEIGDVAGESLLRLPVSSICAERQAHELHFFKAFQILNFPVSLVAGQHECFEFRRQNFQFVRPSPRLPDR